MRNTIKIRKGQLLRLGRGGGRVEQGLAWVTIQGQHEDMILGSGDFLPCCHHDALLEALSEELTLSADLEGGEEGLSLGA